MRNFLLSVLVICALFVLAQGQPLPILQLQQSIAKEIQGNGSHSYQIVLGAGEYVKVEIEPVGIELLWFLRGNVGRDDANYNDATRYTVYIVSDSAETWTVRVAPRSREAAGGRYSIRIAERRSATAADRNLFAAQSLSHAAIQQFIRGDVESVRQSVEASRASALRWEAASQQSSAGVMLNLIGLAYEKLDDLTAAQTAYEQALIRFRAVSDQKNEINTLVNRAELDVRRGYYQQALDAYQQAYEYGRAPGHEVSFLRTCLKLADVYRLTGELTKARDLYAEALTKSRQERETNYTSLHEAQALLGLGYTLASLGKPEQALAHLAEALPAFARYAKTTDVFVADVQKASGDIYLRQGQFEQASKLHQQALATYRKFGHRLKIATTENALGQAWLALGRTEDAWHAWAQGLSLSEAVNCPEEKIAARMGLARLESERDRAAALTHVNEALQLIEGQRARLVNPELRATFLARMQQAYALKIDLLIQQKEDVAALATSERARARSWIELIDEGAGHILQATDPMLADRDRDLRQRIATQLQTQTRLLIGQATTAQKEEVARGLAILLAEHDQLTTQIRQRHPHYAAYTQPAPLTLAEIQQQVLDDQTILLEYALGSARSYVFVATPSTLKTYVLPRRAEIEAAAQRFQLLLAERTHPPTVRNISEKQQWLARVEREMVAATATLSHLLLAPIAAELGNKRLLIVPDGALHYVPFAALPEPKDEGGGMRDELENKPGKRNESAKGTHLHPSSFIPHPLMVRHELLTLPSASTLALLRREKNERRHARKTLALFADPVFSLTDDRLTARQPDPRLALNFARSMEAQRFDRLPATQREAAFISQLVPAAERKIALGFAANRAAVINPEITEYRYVHFATHGLLNNEHPELSGLLLSQVDAQGAKQNGYLLTLDIFNLKLRADLVVLSGCQTGLGKEVSGEGLLGLTRGFMYAGAQRVLASLWQVNDDATAELMRQLYQAMLGEQKLTPAAALRAAQVTMLRHPRWQSPYYWAAFTLQGEW